MIITWTLNNEELEIMLLPETEGDRVVIKYCDNYEGTFRMRNRPDASYYQELEKIKLASILLKPMKDKESE